MATFRTPNILTNMRKNVTELQLLCLLIGVTLRGTIQNYANSMIYKHHRALSNKQLPSYIVTILFNYTHSFYGLITQDYSKAKTS